MIKLKEIKSHYPPRLQGFSLGIMREYIQYKILESIYSSKFTNKLVFLGGTALRIVYDNQRLSEDLDFDNMGLTKNEFEELTLLIKKSLENEGYEIEIRNVFKKAFHCYIKIPDILYKEGLSGLPNQKITIRIDTTPQNYDYKYNTFLLDGFGVYQNIKVVPIELLLAQKFVAALERKRAKGRDFFDISFMFSKKVELDMMYINEKIGVIDKNELKEVVIQRISEIDLNSLAKDVKKFLFNPEHVTRIINFQGQLERLFP